MKKLKKLSINPEKVIKNEELVNLKGGYSDQPDGTTMLWCYDGDIREMQEYSTNYSRGHSCIDACKKMGHVNFSCGWYKDGGYF